MSDRQNVLAVLVVILQCLLESRARTPYIYVRNATEARDDPSCWFGGQDNPCRTLGFALEGIHNTSNSTCHPAVFLEGGEYELNKGSATVFDGTLNPDLRDFEMIGNETCVDHYPCAVVHCEAKTGLTFTNIDNITMKQVWFIGCGAMQHSTSKNFNTNNQTNFPFAQFQVGLYFVYCKDILFTDVWVTDSLAAGVAIYASTGKNIFENCNFSYNQIPEDSDYPGGGGLYLEFPYCNPVVKENCNTTIPPEYVSNAIYVFSNCQFIANHARVTNLSNEAFIIPHKDDHLAFGRGGGLSIFFKGKANNNRVVVNQSNFFDNRAIWGAGLFVEFQDNTNKNSFAAHASNLYRNKCHYNVSDGEGTGGGGTRLGFLFFGDGHVKENCITFHGCKFYSNSAYWGGGVSFYTAREKSAFATNSLEFVNCIWDGNQARLGAAIDLSVWHPVINGSTVQVWFTNTLIVNQTSNLLTPGTLVGLGAVYIDSIPTVFDGYAHFIVNKHSALAAVNAPIDFVKNCIANFLFNKGRLGGAIALFGYALIRVHDNTRMTFVNNSADLKGGAIFARSVGEHDLISSRNCFIRFEQITRTPDKWTSYFHFENNTANGKVNSIYTTTLLPCVWGSANGPYSPTEGLNTTEVFCWNSTHWKYPNSNDNCSNEIETAPAMFNSTTYSMNTFPGQRNLLPVSMTDDLGHYVINRTVYTADTTNSNHIQIDSTSSYIADNSIKLYGTPDDTETQIDLYTLDPRVMYMTVNVTLRPCPPGLIPKITDDRTACECGGDYNGIVHCNQDEFQSQLELQGTWLGYCGEHCPHSKMVIVAGYSPYTFSTEPKLPQNVSRLNKHFCSHSNRRGTLCGECQDGYGPALNSHTFECVKCSEEDTKYHWVFFILSEILPVTIFFAILVLFNISLTSGPANAFIFFAQVLTSNFSFYSASMSHYKRLWASYVVPYDIWNLNFLEPVIPSYCLQPGMKTATVISLDYIVAAFPLILIGTFYFFLWLYNRGTVVVYSVFRPIHHHFARLRSKWDLKRSVVDALAAFLLLSYTKFTTVSIRLLSPSHLYNDTGVDMATVMYYDGTIGYFKHEHFPYVVPALLISILFVVLPPLLLIAYPFRIFHTIIHRLMCTRYERVSLYLNVFYGCYKDGTEPGSRDLRSFAGLYFVLRVVFSVLNSIHVEWDEQYAIQQVLCTVAIFPFILAKPYKNDRYNCLDATMFGLLATINALSNYNYHLAEKSHPSPIIVAVQYSLIWCPLLYMLGYLLHHFWRSYHHNWRFPWHKNAPQRNDIGDDSILRLIDERAPAPTVQEESVPGRDVHGITDSALRSYGSTLSSGQTHGVINSEPRTSTSISETYFSGNTEAVST